MVRSDSSQVAVAKRSKKPGVRVMRRSLWLANMATVGVVDKIFRAGEGRMLRRLEAVAQAVNSHEDTYVSLSDAELRAMTDQFRERLADGENLDDLLPEAFATVREATKRVLGKRHFN